MSRAVPHEAFCQVLFLVIDAKLFSAAGNGQKERTQNAPCGRLEADFGGRQYKNLALWISTSETP